MRYMCVQTILCTEYVCTSYARVKLGYEEASNFCLLPPYNELTNCSFAMLLTVTLLLL